MWSRVSYHTLKFTGSKKKKKECNIGFAIIAGLENYWQITENTFNDEFEIYSEWIYCNFGFGQEFLKFDELILFYFIFLCNEMCSCKTDDYFHLPIFFFIQERS